MTSPTPPFLAFTLVSRRNHRWQRRGQLIEWLAPQCKNDDYLLSWLERFSSTLAGNRLSYLPPFQTNRIINE